MDCLRKAHGTDKCLLEIPAEADPVDFSVEAFVQ